MFQLYNTIAGKKEIFKTLEPGKVKMYSCGPTVYNYAHIGNLSAYIYVDVLRRHLESLGYEVRHIVNITDVGHLTADDINQADSGEDKMLKTALKEKKTPKEIATYYTDSFFLDMEKLNIKKANYYPHATTHVPQMIKIIEKLIEKGLAYGKNGNVFYDVEKFADYGKLSNRKLDELKHGARLEDHPDKKHSYDFALWLKAPKEHLLRWQSPWSEGYPGWHIECSAMSMEYLGETLDIHSGGEDHIFPHHENEIAQSEGTTGKPFSQFWFHNRFLLVDGEKMSKSKDNFHTMKTIVEKGFDPMVFRLLILGSHYRSNLNFAWKRMEEAQKNFEKITRFVSELSLDENQKKAEKETDKKDILFMERFKTALDDDLNTPEALSVLYEFISETNKKLASGFVNKTSALSVWNKMNKVLGLLIDPKTKKAPGKIKELLGKRDVARKNKNFELADKLRAQIERSGFVVKDTQKGQKIQKK